MTVAALVSNNPISLLRAAACELLPVIVDLGPNQANFCSFIDAVEEERGVSVVLSPIAADALPTDPVPLRIRAAQGGVGWSIGASAIERLGPTRARIDLAHARVLPSDDDESAVAVHATDLLVLVVPGGIDEGSTYVFPIQRIGADVCEILSNVALMPGMVLQQVDIVGDRRLLRRTAAQVLATAPWYMADGTRSFSCRLGLSAEPSLEPDQQHDLVTEPREVKRLIELAGMLNAQGWYEAPGWSRGALRFVEVQKDALIVELANEPSAPLSTARSIRIGVELFATAFELDVRAIGFEDGRLQTSFPLILRRRRRHRRDHRVEVGANDHVMLSFRHPVTGTIERRNVLDVSFFAVCFESELEGCVLWPGLPLEQAQLSWRNRLVHLGDIEVDRCEHDGDGSAICIASIRNSQITDDRDMIRLLATLSHPRVRTYDGEDFAALHAMYLKAGLFGPHMHRNLAPIVDQASEVWRRVHRNASDVIRTFLHGPENAPEAAASVARLWEHAWLAQHFVDTSPENSGASGRIQAAYLDHLVPRADGRYLVFFVKTDNPIMNSYLKRFTASTGTPDAVTRSVVELWIRPGDSTKRGKHTAVADVRPTIASDEIVIARAVEQRLGAYAAAALSMIPGELHIPDTEARFKQAGLERRRVCDVVTLDGELTYALVEERATPGINLTWMINATWILPVHPNLDRDGLALDAALRTVVERPAQTATGERFLNLTAGVDQERLQAWGFHREATLYLYALTRAGLHRFHSYSMFRYGELEAMTQRRQRRRSRTSDHSR